jgi:hypothetical protein
MNEEYEQYEKEAIKDLESFFGTDLELTDRGKSWVAGYVRARSLLFTRKDMELAYELGEDKEKAAFKELINLKYLNI